MESRAKITYCADIVARYGKHLVLVERLGRIPGLALPGGKQDPGETLTETAIREFKEETGLELDIETVLETRAEEGRDPRGIYVSTVFVGTAYGIPRDEPRMTKVVFFDPATFQENKHRFVFDHAEILENYLQLVKKNNPTA